MNPFFIFLFFCATVAIIYWFKNASRQQGAFALKGVLIATALLIIVLLAIGRLPILAGIPMLLLALFRKTALTTLLIPVIRLLAGSFNEESKARPQPVTMDTQQALRLLELAPNPTREEIVQAHRQIIRNIKHTEEFSTDELAKLDTAREHLIENSDKAES